MMISTTKNLQRQKNQVISFLNLPIDKLAGPDPTIGRMMTLPLTLYFPTNEN